MVTFQIEKMMPCVPEIKQLIALHWIEVAGYKDKVPLDPDWAKYQQMEEHGGILMVTAREEGRMVGYSIFLIGNMLHYKQTKVASNDVIFLHPAYRKGSTGIRLIKHSHEALVRAGVHRIMWHLKVLHDWRPILERMGYVCEEFLMGAYVGV